MPIMDTETTTMITPSEVIEYIYCPRFIYFMHVLCIAQHEDRRFKVMAGREVHKKRTTQNREYLRKKIGAQSKDIDVYLASPKLRVRGRVDEVLTLSDGSLAPLDYKFTSYREQVFKTHRIQVVLYGLLIRETYGEKVNKGFVAYVRGGSKLLEVPIGDRDERESLEMVERILVIIETGKLPGRTKHKVRCIDCCYKNICV